LVALPPKKAKDVQDWVNELQLEVACSDSWSEAGQRFMAWVEENRHVVEAKAVSYPAEPVLGLVTRQFSTVRPKPVKYLVPDYFPLGKLVLWAGDGGLGKSILTLDQIACLTTGRPCLGLKYDACPPCDVLLVNCEDDAVDTIYPRLLAAGADMQRVFLVEGIKTKEGKPAPFSLAHYDAMSKELEDRPNVRLVVIDPAGAFIGRTGIDDHKDSQLRALLGPLTEVAARHKVTIILVKHINKGVTPKAVHKVSGSTGYVNAVRAAYMVAPDPDSETRRLFLPIKNNLCVRPRAVPYETEALSAEEAEQLLEPFTELSGEDRLLLARQLFRIRYFGQVDISADEVMQGRPRRRKTPTRWS
jgi:RecA-family ATPase